MIKTAHIIAKLKNYFIDYKWLGIFGLLLLILVAAFFLIRKPDAIIVKAHQQVETLAYEIRDFYRSKPDAWGLNTASAIKNKLIPQEMINGRMVNNALGKEILLGADILGNMVMPGNRTVVIVYKNLNKQECMMIVSHNFNEKMQLSLNAISVINDVEHKFSWGGHNPLPITRATANNICQKANDILWEIYL